MARRYSRTTSPRRVAPKPQRVDPNPPQFGKPSKNGYNSSRWSSPYAVRKGLRGLGYGITVNSVPLVNDAYVRNFQKGYNLLHKKYPYRLPGVLVVDGTAGKNTLNAMDWAIVFDKAMPKRFVYYVKKHGQTAAVYP